MNVICTILVVAMHFEQNADVKGIVIGSNKYRYIVDFSNDAKKNDYEGDYSHKLVLKDDCVEIK